MLCGAQAKAHFEGWIQDSSWNLFILGVLRCMSDLMRDFALGSLSELGLGNSMKQSACLCYCLHAGASSP